MNDDWNISRRKLLLGGAATLLLKKFGGALQFPGIGLVNGVFNTDFEILFPTDAGFGSALDQNFPGLSINPDFSSIVPMSLLVTNRSADSILALRIKWQGTGQGGAPRQFSQKFMVRPHHNLHSGSRTGGQPLLGPNATGIVSPLFFWTNLSVAQKKVLKLRMLMPKKYSAATFLKSVQPARKVTVTIDGVLYDSGRAVGASAYKLAQHFRIRRNAEHDEAVAISRVAASETSLSPHILSKLQEHARADILQKQISGKERAYYRERSRYARALIRYSSQQGQIRMLNLLQTIKSSPRTTFHFG